MTFQVNFSVMKPLLVLHLQGLFAKMCVHVFNIYRQYHRADITVAYSDTLVFTFVFGGIKKKLPKEYNLFL